MKGFPAALAALIGIPLAVVSSNAAAQNAPAAKPGLSALLAGELARFSGTGGIWLKSLGTGEEAGVRADQHFDSASTIKMAVMVLAYQLADQHKLNLDDRITVKLADFRGGSGVFRYNDAGKDTGLNPTLRDVITQMVITSDNTATDLMIAKVGGKEAVNAFLKAQGFQVLHLNMTTNDYFRRPYDLAEPGNKLTAEDVFALGLPDDITGATLTAFTAPRKDMIARLHKELADKNIAAAMASRQMDETTWLGIVSPAELGKLVEGIQQGTIASKAACAEMLRIMRAQQAGTRKIPHWLSVPVAHKTGETTGVTNDVGVIYAHSGPIVIAFYTIGYTGLAADADDRLGHVARLIVEYFDGEPHG